MVMKHSKGQGWFICQSLDPFCVKKKTNPKTQEPQKTNIQPHTSMHKKCWQSVKLLITDENIEWSICEMVCDFTGKVSVLIVCVYVTCLPGSYEFAVVKLYWEKNLFKLQNTKKSL